MNGQSRSKIEEIKNEYCATETRCPVSVDCNKNPVLPIDRIAKCDGGKCIVAKPEVSKNLTPTDEDSEVSTDTNNVNSMSATETTLKEYYYCSLPTYQCVAKSIINNTGGYLSQKDCEKDCSQTLVKSIELSADMLKCSYNSDCKIVDTGCCPCA